MPVVERIADYRLRQSDLAAYLRKTFGKGFDGQIKVTRRILGIRDVALLTDAKAKK